MFANLRKIYCFFLAPKRFEVMCRLCIAKKTHSWVNVFQWWIWKQKPWDFFSNPQTFLFFERYWLVACFQSFHSVRWRVSVTCKKELICHFCVRAKMKSHFLGLVYRMCTASSLFINLQNFKQKTVLKSGLQQRQNCCHLWVCQNSSSTIDGSTGIIILLRWPH